MNLTPSYSAPRPAGEELRQAALFATGVLTMRGNARLRAIVEQTAALLELPVAAISIIDRDRQWFPAIHGADLEETSRDIAFCAHTILTPGETMIVCDAREDARFATHPMVIDDPHIRFYIGTPLVTREGAALGALCGVDSQPHGSVPPERETALRALATEAMAEIERLENVRAASVEAIAEIVEQIRAAAEADDEPLLLELDRILRGVEGIAQAG